MNPPHDLTQLYRLSEIVSLAEYLPLTMITRRNTKPIYPVTVGEYLVNYALDLVLAYEWESEIHENAAEPLESLLGELDTGVDRPEAWKELFKANTELKRYLDHQKE